MRRWLPERIDELFRHRLFTLERHRLAAGPARREAVVLRAPDWVNVIPLLAGGEVVLVRQWRYGTAAPTLEIPGGMVEAESEREAAERELLEETGYRARSWRRLGEVHPNPAFLTNRCGTWLATDLERVGEPAGDGEEEIAVERHPLGAIPGLIAAGEITHALVIAAFHHFDRLRCAR
ncbi:MAG TPA: NUDIX hydrolase [Thermoanaerobaculia bacterium]|jgi:8-oxo-dGTP pyrophosphatase MutT (NUDIX family)|nr:NUDIX hydrolase [Thermoanaerobaculia bacterium]